MSLGGRAIIPSQESPEPRGRPEHRPVRLGFAGLGWIGRHRLRAITDSGHALAVAVCDPAEGARSLIAADAPGAILTTDWDELLEQELDGVVIATPSALHAPQAIAALERGIAVFCQKPIARTAGEAHAVVGAARRADRLLGIDLSYRHSRAMQAVRDLIQRGELGAVYAADLVFHNGYGPDKDWFYDPVLSGGGCLIDLGVHLVDLALWALGSPRVSHVSGALYANGALLDAGSAVVEDHATVELRLVTGTTVRVACSWNGSVGSDAVIGAQFHGTRGGAVFRNVNGSFYDFEAVRFSGRESVTLEEPPDEWGGRAAVGWVERLASGARFDPEVESCVQTAEILDVVYGR